MSNLPEINGWMLIALAVGLAAGYIYGFIEGKRFILGQVQALEEAKKVIKQD